MCYAFGIEGRNKPARPPALQVRSSRDRTNRIINAGTIGGPAASPAAGTNATWNQIGGAPALQDWLFLQNCQQLMRVRDYIIGPRIL